MKTTKKNYTIIPLKPDGLFLVKNNLNGKEYEVDIHTPYCKECEAFKWKKKCIHIKMCKGISEKRSKQGKG